MSSRARPGRDVDRVRVPTLGRRPELVADIGAVVTLFWLGLGFLALYHVLWIVYVLVLGSIWPLRTVTPK